MDKTKILVGIAMMVFGIFFFSSSVIFFDSFATNDAMVKRQPIAGIFLLASGAFVVYVGYKE